MRGTDLLQASYCNVRLVPLAGQLAYLTTSFILYWSCKIKNGWVHFLFFFFSNIFFFFLFFFFSFFWKTIILYRILEYSTKSYFLVEIMYTLCSNLLKKFNTYSTNNINIVKFDLLDIIINGNRTEWSPIQSVI